MKVKIPWAWAQGILFSCFYFGGWGILCVGANGSRILHATTIYSLPAFGRIPQDLGQEL